MAVILVTLLGVFLFSGCGRKEEQQTINAISHSVEDIVALEEQTQQVICPLDHVSVENLTYQRPIAVMIENSPAARPQDGLAAAELVFEIPAEGGITRFMALYQHTIPERIGPIRSARDYFIRRALEFDGIYVHCGQSPQAEKMFRAGKVDHLNEMGLGKFFWRIKDRRAPHNLYSSMEKLCSAASYKGYGKDCDFESYDFSSVSMQGGIPEEAIRITYPNRYYVSYDYHAEDDEYTRIMNGKLHADKTTGQQIKPKNIVVQYVSMAVIDSEGRLKVDMVGKGKGILFQGGKQYTITWVKQSESGLTRYYQETGEPVTLMPGKTWIHVVDRNTIVN